LRMVSSLQRVQIPLDALHGQSVSREHHSQAGDIQVLCKT
jgi:hypothetical protein